MNIIKQTWAKVALVVGAFSLMVLSGLSISSRILNAKLLRNVEETMNDTQSFVSYVLSEPILPLSLIAGNIERLYNMGETAEAINAYITDFSVVDFELYGYLIEEEFFLHGMGWIPPEGYDPKERPWFLAGIAASGRDVVTTIPYLDLESGVTIITYTQKLYDNNERFFGVISVDVKMEHIEHLVLNKRITPSSFGFMVDQNLHVIMHPNSSIIGELMGESNHEMLQFSKLILDSSNISMQKVKASTGRQSLAFGRQIDNGWYMIILIPVDEYYKELYEMFLIISLLAAILSSILSIILIKIDYEKNKSDTANRQKSTFLSTMSHEIRTPMNAILGIAEILLQKENLTPDVKEGLEKIFTSGDMLLGIINDILDLSKIESGKLELIPDYYEVASLISDTTQINMMRIGSKPIEFDLEVADNTPAILYGDELRVKQILNNVLSNAFKYTSQGTVKMSVFAELDAGNTIMVFKISDSGQGMTKDQINKLFDEYSRFNLAANRKTEGTGLGMSITRNLIKMMGGEILVESEPEKGSVFTVRLPQGRSDSEVLSKEMIDNLLKFRTKSRAQMKRVQITREPMPYGKVMIVDDVEMNIYVAKGLLAPYGLNIDSAGSGFEAIEKVNNGNVYDIIFMDHMMPEMDGIEATKKIRETGYFFPIVALTANAVAGQAEIFLGNGFDDYISKPIDVRQLNNVLNKLIRDKQPPEVIEEARKQAEKNQQNTDTEPEDNAAIYGEVFIRDAVKSIEVLEKFEQMENKENISDDDLRRYVIHVHGMKGALANLGEMKLSAVAMKLESAGKDKNINTIISGNSGFLASLRALTEKLSAQIQEKTENEITLTLTDEEKIYIDKKLAEIKEAADQYDPSIIEEIISELKEKQLPSDIKEIVNTVNEYFLHSEFEKITEYLEGLPV